jgi:SNF2 family DNA or RNA helicase
MEFIMPGLLGSRTRFLQKHAVTNWSGDVVSYKNIGEVSRKIAPYFIRRLKKNVLKELPDKIYENRIIELSPSERKIYNDIKKKRHEVTENAEAMVMTIRCKQFLDSPELIGEDGDSSKLDSFKEVIREVVVENMHKVIIFSQYKKMTDILVRELEGMGLKCLYIHGGTPKENRASMQKEFNNDDSIDCIVGTEAMSTGLNFIGGDTVINYDDNWAPAIMRQREDRAHRIGQKSTVMVINFICRDTIEERIRERLFEKEIVSNEVLGDGLDEYVLKRLGPKDILGLL